MDSNFEQSLISHSSLLDVSPEFYKGHEELDLQQSQISLLKNKNKLTGLKDRIKKQELSKPSHSSGHGSTGDKDLKADTNGVDHVFPIRVVTTPSHSSSHITHIASQGNDSSSSSSSRKSPKPFLRKGSRKEPTALNRILATTTTTTTTNEMDAATATTSTTSTGVTTKRRSSAPNVLSSVPSVPSNAMARTSQLQNESSWTMAASDQQQHQQQHQQHQQQQSSLSSSALALSSSSRRQGETSSEFTSNRSHPNNINITTATGTTTTTTTLSGSPVMRLMSSSSSIVHDHDHGLFDGESTMDTSVSVFTDTREWQERDRLLAQQRLELDEFELLERHLDDTMAKSRTMTMTPAHTPSKIVDDREKYSKEYNPADPDPWDFLDNDNSNDNDKYNGNGSFNHNINRIQNHKIKAF
eukprot:gene1549-2993_t